MDTGESVKNSDFDVGDIQKALSKKKTGKKGTKTQAEKEAKKQTKELKKLRRQLKSQNQGENSDGKFNIENMEVKADDPKGFEDKLMKELSASGVT
jgi:DNA-binding transcriptional MerR regulator